MDPNATSASQLPTFESFMATRESVQVPKGAGRYDFTHPERQMVEEVTFSGRPQPGSPKIQPKGVMLQELIFNDMRTGMNPIAPYFDQLAALGPGDQPVVVHARNGFVFKYSIR